MGITLTSRAGAAPAGAVVTSAVLTALAMGHFGCDSETGSGGATSTTTTGTTGTNTTAATKSTGVGATSSSTGTTTNSTGTGMAFVCDPPADPSSFYAASANSRDINIIDAVSMCQYRGDVVLVVNTAAN